MRSYKRVEVSTVVHPICGCTCDVLSDRHGDVVKVQFKPCALLCPNYRALRDEWEGRFPLEVVS